MTEKGFSKSVNIWSSYMIART